MRIRRYRPNFCEGFEDEYAEASSKEELLEIPFVKIWAEDLPNKKFLEFCIDERRLLAFYKGSKDNRRFWYVVATFPDGSGEAANWFLKATYSN